jgi:hypothetical protein
LTRVDLAYCCVLEEEDGLNIILTKI